MEKFWYLWRYMFTDMLLDLKCVLCYYEVIEFYSGWLKSCVWSSLIPMKKHFSNCIHDQLCSKQVLVSGFQEEVEAAKAAVELLGASMVSLCAGRIWANIKHFNVQFTFLLNFESATELIIVSQKAIVSGRLWWFVTDLKLKLKEIN